MEKLKKERNGEIPPLTDEEAQLKNLRLSVLRSNFSEGFSEIIYKPVKIQTSALFHSSLE